MRRSRQSPFESRHLDTLQGDQLQECRLSLAAIAANSLLNQAMRCAIHSGPTIRERATIPAVGHLGSHNITADLCRPATACRPGPWAFPRPAEHFGSIRHCTHQAQPPKSLPTSQFELATSTSSHASNLASLERRVALSADRLTRLDGLLPLCGQRPGLRDPLILPYANATLWSCC